MNLTEMQNDAARWALLSEMASFSIAQEHDLQSWLGKSDQHRAAFSAAKKVLSKTERASQYQDIETLNKILRRAARRQAVQDKLPYIAIAACAAMAISVAFIFR